MPAALTTPVTEPVKIGHMTRYPALEMHPGIFKNTLNALHIQIPDTAASITDKMIMGGDIRVKVIGPIAQPQALDLS